MAPTRPLKRQKTNESQSETPRPEQVPLPPDAPSQSQNEKPSTTTDSRLSWYQSWSRKGGKAAASTQVAHESSNDTAAETASILSDRTTPRRPSTRSVSLAMTLGKTGSTRSLPIDAMTSKIHATSDNVSPNRKGSVQADTSNETQDAPRKTQDSTESKNASESTPNPPPQHRNNESTNGELRQSGWFGWMGKNGTKTEIAKGSEQTSANSKLGTKAVDTTTTPSIDVSQNATQQSTSYGPDAADVAAAAATQNHKRTWLQMLGGDSKSTTSVDQVGAVTGADPSQSNPTKADAPQLSSSPKPTEQSRISSLETSPPPPLPGDSNKSAGWVFWSRDRSQRPETPQKDGEQTHEGEIAISDTPSQSKPKRASISMPEEARPDVKSIKDKKSGKAGSVKSAERPQTPDSTKKPETKVMKKLESKNASAVAVESEPPRPASPAPSKKAIDNLLLPAFHDTLHLHQNPTLLQQLARLLYYTKEPELKHLSLVKDPPRIRNALAIGVHGYFPGPMVRTLLGQPTGTSIKFADMAAKSIRKWTNSRGYDCEVKTAALEGEGKIGERVELLWKLLLNWIDEIRKTDFVMVACHSQGVPVAVMLVAKLIQFGCINAARVGICAMAGVSMGPFAEFKSRWISGSAGELFEFSDPTSKVSSNYYSAVETILKSGVRLTFIGSIDDQLVSLESSIFAPLTHPHIYRAVLIDSRIHAPGFLSHLVGFVLKLRNLGVQDHGLIRELSSPLAGSLYTGEGHSRIYEDEAVYDMAISFALETTAQLGVDVVRRNIQASSGNPYILPFAMRGILEEDFVRSELREEANQLLQQFDEWKPTTKALKDVKFRLEGVRSKL